MNARYIYRRLVEQAAAHLALATEYGSPCEVDAARHRHTYLSSRYWIAIWTTQSSK